MSLNNVYFDNAASAPLSPSVAERLGEFSKAHLGNAASIHKKGLQASLVIEEARQNIASHLQSLPEEIVFTSGGTESNNLALIGTALANKERGNHIIISAVEHSSVLESAKWLSSNGFSLSILPVDQDGRVKLYELKALISQKTILVSIQHANNEVGVLQDISSIAKICHESSVLFHTDSSQSFGKVAINLKEDAIDLLTLSSHKIHGPMGVGALFVRSGTKVSPLSFGGKHEGGLRSGSQNVPGIYGFSLAVSEFQEESNEHMNRLKVKLLEGLSGMDAVVVNSTSSRQLPHIVSLSLKSHKGREVLQKLSREGIFVSTSSACSSGKDLPSHVLLAMGKSEKEAVDALRISFSKYNTLSEVDLFLTKLPDILQAR